MMNKIKLVIGIIAVVIGVMMLLVDNWGIYVMDSIYKICELKAYIMPSLSLVRTMAAIVTAIIVVIGVIKDHILETEKN